MARRAEEALGPRRVVDETHVTPQVGRFAEAHVALRACVLFRTVHPQLRKHNAISASKLVVGHVRKNSANVRAHSARTKSERATLAKSNRPKLGRRVRVRIAYFVRLHVALRAERLGTDVAREGGVARVHVHVLQVRHEVLLHLTNHSKDTRHQTWSLVTHAVLCRCVQGKQ